jgi:hypothetical protein
MSSLECGWFGSAATSTVSDNLTADHIRVHRLVARVSHLPVDVVWLRHVRRDSEIDSPMLCGQPIDGPDQS